MHPKWQIRMTCRLQGMDLRIPAAAKPCGTVPIPDRVDHTMRVPGFNAHKSRRSDHNKPHSIHCKLHSIQFPQSEAASPGTGSRGQASSGTRGQDRCIADPGARSPADPGVKTAGPDLILNGARTGLNGPAPVDPMGNEGPEIDRSHPRCQNILFNSLHQ